MEHTQLNRLFALLDELVTLSGGDVDPAVEGMLKAARQVLPNIDALLVQRLLGERSLAEHHPDDDSAVPATPATVFDLLGFAEPRPVRCARPH